MIHFFFQLIYIFFFTDVNAELKSNFKTYSKTKQNLKIVELAEGQFDFPWGITFVNSNTLLITEKNGGLVKFNVKSQKKTEIQHNIPVLKKNNGQGGLLDVLAHSDGYVYFTYSHDSSRTNSLEFSKKYSTAVGRGKLIDNEIKDFQVLLKGSPELNTTKHWGARIVIKDDFLFVGFGERDKGSIAQDPGKHPGSIIRIKTDGSIPKDNPKTLGYEDWLPEIYQIGLRNPQGMAISPKDGNIYFSQHGPMGGDNIGIVKFAGNLGWKDIAWGGREYSGRKIGESHFKDTYDKPIISWVPSIGVGSINFYKGKKFSDWNGDLLISATKTKMLARLEIEKNQVINKEILIKNHPRIGRIRDFEINYLGDVYLISDKKNSSLWKITND